MLMKLEFFLQIFQKYSNAKLHENLYSGIQVLPWGQMEEHGYAKNNSTIFAAVPTNR